MKKYKVIYADPPWHYGSKSAVNNSSGSEIKPLKDQYTTTKTKDLCNMDVKSICEDESVLFMWVTDSHLPDALEIIKAWGFKYKTIAFNWVKTTSKGNYCKNVAPWTMKSSEICLIATRGAMTKHKIKNNVESLVFSERTKHSKKPDEVRERITDLFGDVSRLEMFARTSASGWDVFGNEAPNSIEIGIKENA